MANIKSSKKDVKNNAKRRARNLTTRTSLKTYIKKVKQATPEVVEGALALATKALDKAVQRGIIHKNQAARRKSRAAKAANAIKAAS